MLDVYEQTKLKFSVDDFSHYLYTPRDLTKWILGLLRYDLENQDLFEAWVHESNLLFRDRIVDSTGKQRFDRIVEGVLKAQWNLMPNLANNYFSTWAQPAALTDGTESTTNKPDKIGGRKLLKMSSADYKEFVARSLLLYEREIKELHIQLFSEVLEHISRIDRVLAQPGGNMLLVGKSGVGRRTAVSLTSYIYNMRVFTPNITKGYTTKHFRNDLKSVLQVAGVEGSPVVLMLEDQQFVENEFIEYVNSLLSSGEIPGLYTPEEVEPLLSPLKDKLSEQGAALQILKKEKKNVSFRNIFLFFFKNLQNRYDFS